jgi:hypothetical protein
VVDAHDVGMARARRDHLTMPNGVLISLSHHIICVAASFCNNAYTTMADGLGTRVVSLSIHMCLYQHANCRRKLMLLRIASWKML